MHIAYVYVLGDSAASAWRRGPNWVSRNSLPRSSVSWRHREEQGSQRLLQSRREMHEECVGLQLDATWPSQVAGASQLRQGDQRTGDIDWTHSVQDSAPLYWVHPVPASSSPTFWQGIVDGLLWSGRKRLLRWELWDENRAVSEQIPPELEDVCK